MRTFGFVCHEVIDFRDGSIEANDLEAMVCSVHDQVLAHNGQTNEAKISTRLRLRYCTDIDAGQSRSRLARFHRQRQFTQSEMKLAELAGVTRQAM